MTQRKSTPKQTKSPPAGNVRKSTKPRGKPKSEAVCDTQRMNDSSAVNPGYRINTEALDPFDPGSIIYHTVVAKQQQQLDAAGKDALGGAIKVLLRLIVGGPRCERTPRAFVHFHGSETLNGDLRIASPDGKYSATPVEAISSLTLRPIKSVIVSGRGGEWDVTSRLFGDLVGQSPENAFGTELVRVGFRACEGRGLPGLLWEMPAAISTRLVEVRALGGSTLPWRLDRRGRIYVPPQPDVELPVSGGLAWVEFALPVRPGEWDCIGKLRSGVAEFAVRCDDPGEEFLAPPAGSLSYPPVALEFDEMVEQPFDGTPGECGEDEESWRVRAAQEIRHRGRAVTADDYRDLIGSNFPVCVLGVEATSLMRRKRLRPGVRLTIVPRVWSNIPECLEGGLLFGKEVEMFLAGKTVEGVEVVAGPPNLRIETMPRPGDPLWPYRDYLTDQRADEAVRDGVYWPVAELHQLREVSHA